MNPPTVIALVPARSGSKRVPDKNIRDLGGHPLIARTIAAALSSEVFAGVMVSTDAPRIAAIAEHYGAEVPFLRPAELAADDSPDIAWVEHALRELGRQGRRYDAYSILRPTSPFRTAGTIRRAWEQFSADPALDSLRAVERCRQHPGKMWVIRHGRLLPLLPFGPEERPWHSSATQSLPAVYVQNASLEISWCRVALERHSIAGEAIVPFLTEGCEGFDINDPEDFERAERWVAEGRAALPPVELPPYRGEAR